MRKLTQRQSFEGAHGRRPQPERAFGELRPQAVGCGDRVEIAAGRAGDRESVCRHVCHHTPVVHSRRSSRDAFKMLLAAGAQRRVNRECLACTGDQTCRLSTLGRERRRISEAAAPYNVSEIVVQRPESLEVHRAHGTAARDRLPTTCTRSNSLRDASQAQLASNLAASTPVNFELPEFPAPVPLPPSAR